MCIVVSLNFVEILACGNIYTYVRKSSQSIAPFWYRLRKEGSLNRWLCQTYSVQIRRHKGCRGNSGFLMRVGIFHHALRAERSLSRIKFLRTFSSISFIRGNNMCTPVSRTIKVYKIGANINRKYLKRFKHRNVNEGYQVAIIYIFMILYNITLLNNTLKMIYVTFNFAILYFFLVSYLQYFFRNHDTFSWS